MSSSATSASNSKLSAASASPSSSKKKSYAEVVKSPAAPKTSQSAEKQGKKAAEIVLSDSDSESDKKDRNDSLKRSLNVLPKKAGPMSSLSNPAPSSQPAKNERADKLRQKLAAEKPKKRVPEYALGFEQEKAYINNLQSASAITAMRDKNKEVIYNNSQEQEAETEQEDNEGTSIEDDIDVDFANVRQEQKEEDASMQDEVIEAEEVKAEAVEAEAEDDKGVDDHKPVECFKIPKIKNLSLSRQENSDKAAIVLKAANAKKKVSEKKLPIKQYGLAITNPKNAWVTAWKGGLKLDNIIEDNVIQWAVLGSKGYTFTAMWETKKEVVQHMADLFISHSSEIRGLLGLRVNEEVPKVDTKNAQAVLECFLNMRLFIKNKTTNKRAYVTPAQIICKAMSLSIPVHLVKIGTETVLADRIDKAMAESRALIDDDEKAVALIAAAVYETYTTYVYETAANIKSKKCEGIDFSKVLSFPATLVDNNISHRYAAAIKSKSATFEKKREAAAEKLRKKQAEAEASVDDDVIEVKQVEKKQKVDKSEKPEKKAPAPVISRKKLVDEVTQKLSAGFESKLEDMKLAQAAALKAQEEKYQAQLKAREEEVAFARKKQDEQAATLSSLEAMMKQLLEAKCQPQPQPDVVEKPAKKTGKKRKSAAVAVDPRKGVACKTRSNLRSAKLVGEEIAEDSASFQ
jgi:hypothetical protein